jgi:Cof subfamily protein (haloacid dehalogenase superfamily)
MKKLNYSLIVSDFDGTLAKNDSNVSEETKQSIVEYIKNGGTFGICTGRMLDAILPKAKKLGFKGLLAGFNGGFIIDIETGELLAENYLSVEDAVEICKVFEDMGLHIHAYEKDVYYCNMDDEPLKLYEKACGTKAIIYDEAPISKLIQDKNLKIVKFLMMVDPKNQPAVYARAIELLGDKYYVTYSADFFVEVMPKTYSKATAVEFMANYYGVSIEKTIAVGDSYNDYPMLERAGLGIAVANADKRLKEKFTVLEYSNEENAIGKIIEKYGYEE